MSKSTLNKKNVLGTKALFIQRFVSFIIDVFIISFFASLIATPFVDVNENKKIEEELYKLVENEKNSNIEVQDYFIELSNVVYKYYRVNGIIVLVTLFLNVLYYVVFQVYNNGQTVGKKLLKIKVVSDKDDLSINQMILRSLLVNSLLIDIIIFALMIFAPRSVFFYLVCIFEFIQYFGMFISVCMIVNRNDGKSIHDLIASTSVVRI